jgi:hypothetical protein
MAIVEAEQSQNRSTKSLESGGHVKRWAQIYSYSYSRSLTGCVAQLEQLQKYTKEIVGEQGYTYNPVFVTRQSTQSLTAYRRFDPIDMIDYEELTSEQVNAHGILDGNESRS